MSKRQPWLGFLWLTSFLPTIAWSDAPVETVELHFSTQYRTAFYEEAPESLAILMRNAVTHACDDKKNASRLPSWLCNGTPTRVLRAVVVTGDESFDGFVCAVDQISRMRYYAPDEIEENTNCFFVGYEDDAKMHIVRPRP